MRLDTRPIPLPFFTFFLLYFQNNLGESALHCAAQYGHTYAVDILLKVRSCEPCHATICPNTFTIVIPKTPTLEWDSVAFKYCIL